MAHISARINPEDLFERSMHEFTYKGKSLAEWADFVTEKSIMDVKPILTKIFAKIHDAQEEIQRNTTYPEDTVTLSAKIDGYIDCIEIIMEGKVLKDEKF